MLGLCKVDIKYMAMKLRLHQRHQTIRKCNYRCWMLSTDFSTNCAHCAPIFIQNSDNLITLGCTSAENKGLECTILTKTLKVGFQTMFFYINFGLWKWQKWRVKSMIIVMHAAV